MLILQSFYYIFVFIVSFYENYTQRMKYLVLLMLVIIFQLSCESQTLGLIKEEKLLYSKMDSIFDKYIIENDINGSILDYYNKTDINCNDIDKLLKDVFNKDQGVRNDSEENMYYVDSINLVTVTTIYKKCRPKLLTSNLEWRAYSGLHISIHHSVNPDLMAYFYHDLRVLVKEKKLAKIDLAVFVDRFLIINDKKQIFGTQYSYQIEDSDNLNVRRGLMEMKPIE